jgi:tetratricopeptide (TPR) repeat protein
MDDQQAALLFGLGLAQTATFELSRAREVVANLRQAFEYYARQGDLERAVAVAECPVDALPGQPVGAASLVASALALVGQDTHAAGRLLSRYARMVAIEAGDYETASKACEQALAIARREGDVRLEIQTLGNGAEADINYLRWEQGLGKCMRGVELAEHTDAMQAEMLPRFFASIVAWQMGDLTLASAQAAGLLSRAELLHDRRWQVNALWIAGTLARYTADWSAARELLDRGAGLSPADPRILWTRITLEHDVGDDSLVRTLVARLLEVVPLTPPEPNLAQASTALVLAAVADAGVAETDLRMAEAAAEAILSFSTATPIVLRFARASLAVLAVQRGDAAAAQRHYPALEAAQGTFIYETMPGDRLLGLLATTLGNRNQARRHFEAALSFCRGNGCDHELAWTCYDLAALLRADSDLGGAERARDLLDAALGIARDLGMHRLLRRGRAVGAEKAENQS